MARDITQLLGRELEFNDAQDILKELETDGIGDYWCTRQTCWKAHIKDIVSIQFNVNELDKMEILSTITKTGWSGGWPEIDIDQKTGLIRLGAEFSGSSPTGGCWVTVKKFQLDNCTLLPADFEKGLMAEFSHVILTPW